MTRRPPPDASVIVKRSALCGGRTLDFNTNRNHNHASLHQRQPQQQTRLPVNPASLDHPPLVGLFRMSHRVISDSRTLSLLLSPPLFLSFSRSTFPLPFLISHFLIFVSRGFFFWNGRTTSQQRELSKCIFDRGFSRPRLAFSGGGPTIGKMGRHVQEKYAGDTIKHHSYTDISYLPPRRMQPVTPGCFGNSYRRPPASPPKKTRKKQGKKTTSMNARMFQKMCSNKNTHKRDLIHRRQPSALCSSCLV